MPYNFFEWLVKKKKGPPVGFTMYRVAGKTVLPNNVQKYAQENMARKTKY